MAMNWLDRFRRLLNTAPTVDDKTQLAALRAEVESLREALPGGIYDPDANLSATGGGSRYFRRLSQTQRDLDPMDHEKAQSLSYWLWENNPYAKRIINNTVDYILGEGVTVESTDDDPSTHDAMQKVIDKFWFDPINRMDVKLFDKAREVGIYGEQCYPVTINPVDGHVRLGSIDPYIIQDVITKPENAEIPVAVKVRTSPSQPPIYYRIVHIDERPGSPTFGRMVGVETSDGTPMEQVFDPAARDGRAIEFDGACFYWAVNKVSNARRGRPDLLPVIDWVDGYDQFLACEQDRGIFLKTFVWDVTLDGFDDQQIQTWLSKEGGPPNPGSIRAHNAKVQWNPVSPDLKSVDSQILGDLLTGYICAGAGIPKTWLSATEDVNRATAAELGEPAFKMLTARQRLIKYQIESLITFVLDQAEMASALPRRPVQPGSRWPVPWAVQAQFPELRPKDMAASATSFSTLANGLVAARGELLIDEENARKLMATLSGQLGIEIDIEQMTDALEKEEKERDAKAELAPYASGGAGGNAPTDETPNGSNGSEVPTRGPFGREGLWEHLKGKHNQHTHGDGGGSSGGESGGGKAVAVATRAEGSTAHAVLSEPLSGKERNFARQYTGAGAHVANTGLRKPPPSAAAKPLIGSLDSAIAKSRVPADTTFYRGLALSDSAGAKLKIGGKISDKGYVSTSRKEQVAADFAGKGEGAYVMHIKVRKGGHALDAGPYSSNKHEQEMVLPRGSSFRITGLRPGSAGRTIVEVEAG